MEALTVETSRWLLDQLQKFYGAWEAKLEAEMKSGLKPEQKAWLEAELKPELKARLEAVLEPALPPVLEPELQAKQQAVLESELQAALDAALDARLKARREGAPALTKELIEEPIRYLESVEERRREEAFVRPSLSFLSDYRSPDLNMLSPRMYGKGSTDAEQVPEKTPGRLSFWSMRRCSPDRNMLIFPNTKLALVTDPWSCSLGSERTLVCPRVYGKDLKDYVEQVPDSRSGSLFSERTLVCLRVYGKDLKDYGEQVPDSRSGSLFSERTLSPYVTGTSVLGLKYRDGILIAADMGGSYGSTLRYKTIERIKPIGKHCLLGASGEISDFQEILRYLDELILYDNMWDDGNSLGPKEVHNYLTRVMYNRRNKFNPLWNSLVLGGVKNGQKYLGMVSMIGVSFEENHVATGFGNHLALPILRDEWNENLSFEDAVKLLEKCMRVLLYRDRSAVNKLQIVKITEEGATNFPPYSLKTFWGFESYENPTVGEEGHHLKMTN